MTARKLTPSELSLLDVIKASIASEPYEFDGRLWCQKSHRERAQAIGANSTKTVERALKKSPFVTDTTIIKGVGKVVLARIAQPGEKPTPRTYAKQMRTVWRGWLATNIPKRRKELEAEKAALESLALKTPDPTDQKEALDKLEKVSSLLESLRTDLTETNDEFGCFIGLAQVWPEGAQVEILEKAVFGNWPLFMTYVKQLQAQERAAGQSPRALVYDYPHIPTMRLYWKAGLMAALDYYQTRYTKTGEHPPAGFKALNPGLWKHLK